MIWVAYIITWLATSAIILALVLSGHSAWWALLLLIPAGMEWESGGGSDSENT